MRIHGGLVGPMLIQQKDPGIVLRMINLKAKTTWLGAGQPPLFREQRLDFGDIRRFLDGQNNIQIDHVNYPLVSTKTKNLKLPSTRPNEQNRQRSSTKNRVKPWTVRNLFLIAGIGPQKSRAAILRSEDSLPAMTECLSRGVP